jgi:predicted RNA-binding protein with PIN domain
MQWLIDGYNVMHAAGAIDGREGRVRFRLARRRFLNDLAAGLGPLVHDATVVFDASKPPGDFPIESVYKGITVVFALADEDADARIERIIAHHSHPKDVTVVSSDRRVRLAATRRKARAMKADDFLDRLTTLAYERPNPDPDDHPEAKPPAALMDDAEKAFWQEVFGSIDDDPVVRKAMKPEPTLLTDAEIEQIQREIDEEE